MTTPSGISTSHEGEGNAQGSGCRQEDMPAHGLQTRAGPDERGEGKSTVRRTKRPDLYCAYPCNCGWSPLRQVYLMPQRGTGSRNRFGESLAAAGSFSITSGRASTAT